MDEIFEGRLIKRAAAASALKRAAAEPGVRHDYKLPVDPAGAETVALWRASCAASAADA